MHSNTLVLPGEGEFDLNTLVTTCLISLCPCLLAAADAFLIPFCCITWRVLASREE